MPIETAPASARIPGLRLARHGARLSPARMERFLRRLGVPISRHVAMAGGLSLRDFARANPTWSQRAWEVMVLENLSTLQDPDENAPQVPHSDRRHRKIPASRRKAASATGAPC